MILIGIRTLHRDKREMIDCTASCLLGASPPSPPKEEVCDEFWGIFRHGGERKYFCQFFLFVVCYFLGKIVKALLVVGLIARNDDIRSIPSFP